MANIFRPDLTEPLRAGVPVICSGFEVQDPQSRLYRMFCSIQEVGHVHLRNIFTHKVLDFDLLEVILPKWFPEWLSLGSGIELQCVS